MEVLLDIRDYLADRDKPQSPSLAGTTSAPHIPIEATHVSTPIFKAGDIKIQETTSGRYWVDIDVTWGSIEKAEQAREALLKLTQ